MNNSYSKQRNQAIFIIEMFEELLEKYNITIPSEDRTGDETEARIFGEEYFQLEDRITKLLEDN